MAEKYGSKISEVTAQPWCMRDFVFPDPSVVLWRIGHSPSEEELKVEAVLRIVKAWDTKNYTNYPGGKPARSVLRFSISAAPPCHGIAILYPMSPTILSGEISV